MKKAFKTTMAAVALGSGMAGLTPAPTQAVTFHVGSGSIDGSLCVGLDCPASPSFGFTTLLLMENNLRLKFDDTSSAASFPNQDWSLEANETANGGLNAFFIRNCGVSSQGNCSGNAVFTTEAGARNNALYVESDGDIGIGTNNPAVDVDIKTGNTPTVRLQQDGSSGFAAQSWDVAGNEAGFFIRDVTGGSTLPLRIRPGAPSQALVIDSDGDIGVGTLTADEALHIKKSDGSAVLKVEENSTSAGNLTMMLLDNAGGRPRLQMTGDGSAGQTGDWSISAGNTFVLQDRTDSQNVMIVDQDGNMTLTGELTTSGSCSIGCDRVFDADYALLSLEEHTEAMWKNGYLPNVGPTPEDGTFNVSDKMGRMLNELEHAHIYIAQQQEEITQLKVRLTTLEVQ